MTTSFASPRSFVTALISGLQKDGNSDVNDLAKSKQSLLTLHVLFQNELLPALDLLDRSLVIRLKHLTRPQQADLDGRNANNSGGDNGMLCAYYVRSAQQSSSSRSSNSRFRNAAYEHTTYYEVRLEPWSCSCPAFAFSAFPAAFSDTPSDIEIPPQPLTDPVESTQSWTFGGLTRGTDMPVCKHLLACVLVEHSTLFAHMVEERTVTLEELAGWAAGWGD